MNVWVVLAGWVGLSVPVALATGALLAGPGHHRKPVTVAAAGRTVRTVRSLGAPTA